MNDFAPERRVIAAALRLAERGPWRDVSMNDIAVEAGEPLDKMRDLFKTKGAIIKAFIRETDAEVLAQAPKKVENETARDRLFEVIMNRFDALNAHKGAVRSIAEQGSLDQDIFQGFMASQAWMLNAAGVPTDGLGGRVRVSGLASIYAAVFRTWLQDDDPGMARTMAALDRRLRRGERAYKRLEDVRQGAERMGETLSGLFDRLKARGASPRDEATTQSPPPQGQAAPPPPPPATPPTA
ncbi:MAG: TetR/AcrR family transcriptional regulator [Pseudomonadota bacterium]